MSKRHGNSEYWCFLEEGWDHKEVAIWKGPDGQETVIARAVDKYQAKAIVDALLNFRNTKTDKLGTKEIAFLEFVEAQCPEPYATMAANAILWEDLDVYNKLKSDFNVIYS